MFFNVCFKSKLPQRQQKANVFITCFCDIVLSLFYVDSLIFFDVVVICFWYLHFLIEDCNFWYSGGKYFEYLTSLIILQSYLMVSLLRTLAQILVRLS